MPESPYFSVTPGLPLLGTDLNLLKLSREYTSMESGTCRLQRQLLAEKIVPLLLEPCLLLGLVNAPFPLRREISPGVCLGKFQQVFTPVSRDVFNNGFKGPAKYICGEPNVQAKMIRFFHEHCLLWQRDPTKNAPGECTERKRELIHTW